MSGDAVTTGQYAQGICEPVSEDCQQVQSVAFTPVFVTIVMIQ